MLIAHRGAGIQDVFIQQRLLFGKGRVYVLVRTTHGYRCLHAITRLATEGGSPDQKYHDGQEYHVCHEIAQATGKGGPFEFHELWPHVFWIVVKAKNSLLR